MAMPPKKKPVAQTTAAPFPRRNPSIENPDLKKVSRTPVKKSLNEGLNESGANNINSTSGGSSSKTRKRLFGGTVTVAKGKKYDYNGEGYTRNKSKVVVNKKGDITKTVSKSDKYLPTGKQDGRLSESRKVSSTKTTKKYNNGSNKPSSVRVKTKLSNKKNG